jgi:hypothetical protein
MYTFAEFGVPFTEFEISFARVNVSYAEIKDLCVNLMYTFAEFEITVFQIEKFFDGHIVLI